MKRIRGKNLANQFVSQGVEIHPEIEETLRLPAEEDGSPWLPTNVLAAVTEAARLSRVEDVLANRVIRKTERIANDTPANTLVNIINDSITRDMPPPASYTSSSSDIDSCPQAELFFIEALEELGATRLGDAPQYTRQIVHDHGRPLIFRKNIEVQSGLTLAPVSIEGITYPAGSIMGVEAAKEAKQSMDVPLSSVNRLSFLRLSAFALRPEERIKNFRPDPEIYEDPHFREAFLAFTVGQIGRIVNDGLVKIRAISQTETPLPVREPGEVLAVPTALA